MSGGVPYLGSKISLVSKSEIRYEGILYTIDTKESTVALAKVRSFGTEGRPTDRPVAPREEVYEYIIFRASDIKDLHVCEPPKSHLGLSGLANDPAIVQHSAPLSYPMAYGHPSFGALCGLPTFQQYAGQSGFPHISAFFPGSHIAGSRSGSSTQKRTSTVDACVQVSGLTSELNKDSKTGAFDQVQTKGRLPDNVEPLRRNASMTRRQPQRQRGSQRRGRGLGRNINAIRNERILKFDSDYDFEQANAEFLELENKLGKTKIDASENPDANSNEVQFYDRQKSFFDNISCEASQRNERFDWRQERKLNVETFGVPRSNTWLRRRRGRGAFRGRAGFASRPMTRTGGNQKIVKFEDDIEKPVEIIVDNSSEAALKESELPTIELSEIPTIELIVEKDKDAWKDQPSSSKNDWK